MFGLGFPAPACPHGAEPHGVASQFGVEPVDHGVEPLLARAVFLIEEAGLHGSQGHQRREEHARFFIPAAVSPEPWQQVERMAQQFGGTVGGDGEFDGGAVGVEGRVGEGVGGDIHRKGAGCRPFFAQLLRCAADVGGDGFAQAGQGGDRFAEGARNGDALFGRRAVVERQAGDAAQFMYSAQSDDAEPGADPPIIRLAQGARSDDAATGELFGDGRPDPPDAVNRNAVQQPVPVRLGREVEDAVVGVTLLGQMVGEFGQRFRFGDADGDGQAGPAHDRGADLAPVGGEAAPFKSCEVEEGFVDRIDFQVRGELCQGIHDALGHIAIERKIGGEDAHAAGADEVTDLIDGHAAADAEGLGLAGEGDDAAVIVGEDDDGTARERGVEDPLAGGEEAVAVDERDGRHGYTLWTTCVTTPQTCSDSSRISIGGYLSLSGNSINRPCCRLSRLTVSSPSTMAMTTVLSAGSRDRSTMSRSPEWMPAPVMESPVTRTKNVAAGCLMRCWLRSSLPSR